MKTLLKYIILITYCLFLISINGCEKKYEEGPLISLRSFENRFEGKWSLDKYSIDGDEYTERLDNNGCYFITKDRRIDSIYDRIEKRK